MVNAMEPRYPVPTRQHLTKVCVPRLYAQTKAHVKASLGKAERVALTCDGWTSRTTEAYVTITAHFINEEWDLVTYVLQTRDMPESHTGHNLAEHLRKALAEWEITEKDPVIVTDNASNMTIAAEEAAFTLHVKCYAHTLNLAAQRALKITAVARLLGRVRRIVNFFRQSTTANHMLKEKQRLLQLPEHKLMTDVVTRWNSAHNMLERFLEQQPAICAALLSSEVRKTEKDLCTLTESDVTTAEEVVSALKPMKEATQYMSKEKTPTLSVIAPLQDTLINGLKPIEGESAVIKEMKAAMSGDLQKRYIDLKATLHACSAMDPRFKSLPFLTENQRQEDSGSANAIREGTGTCNGSADDEGMASEEETVDDDVRFKEGESSQGQHPPPRNPKPSCPLAALLGGERYGGGAQPKTNTQENQAKQQMTRYKEADLLEVKEDPLVRWKEHQYEYPLLSHLAKRQVFPNGPQAESPRDNCIVQTTEWSECSATCDMGVSSRITNDNQRCQLERQSRMCMVRPCNTQQGKEIKKGKKCIRTPKAQHGFRFKLSGCSSTRVYKQKFCGVCTDNRCCTPHTTITAEVEFECTEGETFTKKMMFIKTCSCHHECPQDNDIFLASNTRSMIGDYDNDM
ncbi:hypothetical protein JOQ06_022231 [Pogonophryne albipinna]|uniref:CTCK domain-containing protein n=1 Tax=Pogonophryne albipinna TaxID=1090488 RepID=A0AAD6F2Z0_9TELE|nr:hypothetical protein JOQ06_022231 [Pogonophryne albipinna]